MVGLEWGVLGNTQQVRLNLFLLLFPLMKRLAWAQDSFFSSWRDASSEMLSMCLASPPPQSFAPHGTTNTTPTEALPQKQLFTPSTKSSLTRKPSQPSNRPSTIPGIGTYPGPPLRELPAPGGAPLAGTKTVQASHITKARQIDPRTPPSQARGSFLTPKAQPRWPGYSFSRHTHTHNPPTLDEGQLVVARQRLPHPNRPRRHLPLLETMPSTQSTR